MPELIAPSTRLRESWLAARSEWDRASDHRPAGVA
jgi:hypothetical protein